MAGWVLTENADPDGEGGYENSEPLKDHPTLYREFAAIPFGDREAAVNFAGRYGMLDVDPERLFFHGRPPINRDMRSGVGNVRLHGMIPCDPECFWTEYPALFRILIRAWESWRRGDTKQLNTLFRWEKVDAPGGKSWVCRPDPKQDDAPGVLPRIVYPDSGTWTGLEPSTLVAETFLCAQVTEGAGFGGLYRVRFGRDSATAPRLGFKLEPDGGHLLAALFLQLGQAIEGNRNHKRCPSCGTWFELVPQDKGRKAFCGGACKAKGYRTRKAGAIELAAAGTSVKAIANQTGIDIEKVKKWTKGVKRTRKE
jgi:hypothetical protein